MIRVDLPGERWLPVPGYEGRYEVSDKGRLWSLMKNKFIKWRDTSGWGHHIVQIYDANHKKWSVGIHRLMLLAFVGGGEGLEACHRNGISSDNRLENLYWGTHADNMRDMLRHGKHGQSKKTHCRNGHEYSEANTYVKPSTGERMCRICVSDQRRRSALKARKVA